MWYNIRVKRRECVVRSIGDKTSQKKFIKPLDKYLLMWYNIRGQGAEKQKPQGLFRGHSEKIFEKVFKNPLTNTTKYDIIYVSVRENIPLK